MRMRLQDAYAYGDELRRIVRFLGISDGNMAEGSMRCDVNISVRPRGREAFGTKVEIKNMNRWARNLVWSKSCWVRSTKASCPASCVLRMSVSVCPLRC